MKITVTTPPPEQPPPGAWHRPLVAGTIASCAVLLPAAPPPSPVFPADGAHTWKTRKRLWLGMMATGKTVDGCS